MSSVKELLDALPGFFKCFGRLLAQVMNAPMNITIFFFIKIDYPLNYLSRFLSRCSIIKINERFSVYSLVQDWKIVPYMDYVNTHDGYWLKIQRVKIIH